MNDVQLKYKLHMAPNSVWIIVTPSEIAKSSIMYVQELGDFISYKNYFTKREGLSSYLIKYTLSGEGSLEYGGKQYSIGPNQLFWIDCKNPQYYFTSPKNEEWRVLWVHFFGANSSCYYQHFMTLNNNRNVVTMPSINGVETAIRSLLSLNSNSNSHTLLTDIQSSSILASLMSECICAAADSDMQPPIPESVYLARTYILNNYHQRISLDDLAKRFAISKYYFEKLFKQHIGKTPNQFLILTRINRAKELLRTTNLLVSEISEKVGVPNINHFYNLFKKHEDLTPAVYRKLWRNNYHKK